MYQIPRCQVVPLADDAASFRVDGHEVTQWRFSPGSKGPFFYPVNGPSGACLTRMGHPGAPNHDHHRSVWFAHHAVLGIDFWAMSMPGQMRQLAWMAYHDADDECGMAVEIGWFDGHDPEPLLRQELVAMLRPGEQGEYTLELQSTFRPTAAELEFQKTNFGFLAVRMAKSISAYFGGGELTGASGGRGEPELFGKANAWMDYSGPVRNPIDGETVVEGITYFDHPTNPHFPAKWHVRQDGWMGASACRDAGLVTRRESPLVLRYLLHIHAGNVNPERAETLAADWTKRPMIGVQRATRSHYHYELQRLS